MDQVLEQGALSFSELGARKRTNLLERIEEGTPIVGQARRQRPTLKNCAKGPKAATVALSEHQSLDVAAEIFGGTLRDHGSVVQK
jgi:hypothetical protein